MQSKVVDLKSSKMLQKELCHQGIGQLKAGSRKIICEIIFCEFDNDFLTTFGKTKLWCLVNTSFFPTADGRLPHMPRSVGADVITSMAPLTGERKSSAPIHSSQPVLFTFDEPVRRTHHSSLSNSAPQDYLLLHQCMSRKRESTR